MTERLPEEIIQRGSQEEVSDAIENDLKLLGKITMVALLLECVADHSK